MTPIAVVTQFATQGEVADSESEGPLPGGRGSGAKSSGKKRLSSWQMRRRLSPGTTSALIARSVSTSLGIISKSAVARRHGNSMYLQTEGYLASLSCAASC